MKNIFLIIYNCFLKRKYTFIFSIIALIAFIAYFSSQVKLEEDVKSILSQDAKVKNINLVLDNSKLSDKLIITISSKDSKKSNPDSLLASAEDFVSKLGEDSTLIKKVSFKVDQSTFLGIYDFFYENLPLYLDDKDYAKLDTFFTKNNINKTLEKDLKSLISPAGIATKRFIFKDPYSITPIALEKLKAFQLDKNFDIYNECIFTKDQKHLLIFIDPKYSSGNTKENSKLIEKLDLAIDSTLSIHQSSSIEYYGGTAVAVANANRIKSDIMLTLTIVFVLIVLLLYLYFKNFKLIALMFMPVAFGFGIAISIISITTGTVSAIAFGIGSILVGISVDYPLYIFTQFKNQKTITEILKDLSIPLLMCCSTTAVAFLCLYIIPSPALNQIGLFGALSVTFTAIFVLIFIPFALTKLNKNGKIWNAKSKTYFIEKIADYPIENKTFVFCLVIGLSILFFAFSGKPRFNSDIATLNYLPPHLAQAEKNLNSISSESKSAVYFVSVGSSMEEALNKAELTNKKLSNEDIKKLYQSKSSGADLILSAKEQEKKIEKWNSFWDKINRSQVEKLTKDESKNFKFKDEAFSEFYGLIQKDFKPIQLSDFQDIEESFLSNYVISNDSVHMMITILKVDKSKKDALFQKFEHDSNVIIFDKQHFSNNFFSTLKTNFENLVDISMIVVFLIILVSTGRIELAIITMTPVYLSWIWTLGLMGVFGLEFNVFNIIISSFLFGSGVDYCIITLQGIQNNYKYGNHSLKPYRLSVLLSSRTSLIGVGALLFAQHPALKSIALLSIFGIASVVLLANVLIPRMFKLLTVKNNELRNDPLSLSKLILSIFNYIILLVNLFFIISIIPILIILPISKKKTRYLFRVFICLASKSILFLTPYIWKRRIKNKEKLDFSKPKVIIANHQSVIDLMLLLQLSPKLIVLTNEDVWNNPIYGLLVRYAEYIPVHKGADHALNNIQEKINDGYSVIVFPEGTRTNDGKIKRFHQGAFMLADNLGLDIQPIIIQGAFECNPKAEILFGRNPLSLTVLDPIKVEHIESGSTDSYRAQAKATRNLMQKELDKLIYSAKGTAFYLNLLRNKFIYKGPVLEWYVKIKVRLERGYDYYNSIIPTKAKIVDIGCGYGYFAYLLNLISPEREIVGIDYDEEKIAIANNLSPLNKNLNFRVMDIENEELPKADVFILLDVLHYMPEELQFSVLEKCMDNLNPEGMIIYRDADADLVNRTKVTKSTEFNSTKLVKFNKTQHKLSFISGKKIEALVAQKGFKFERVDKAKYTSNVTYIITR